MGRLNIIGIGPGDKDNMTLRAYNTISESDVIVGYTGYISLIKEIFKENLHQEVISTGMGSEKERCIKALELANDDKSVSLVCSGDSVIYGMAGLVYELSNQYPEVEINVIPGVSAAISGSALIGAGLGDDFAVISLSNYMTQKEDTYKRLEMCGKADMVMAFYNPSSKTRPECLKEACQFLMTFINEDRLCAIAQNIGRENQQYKVMTLKELSEADTDMFTTVFIGSSKTVNIDGKFVTKRGYSL